MVIVCGMSRRGSVYFRDSGRASRRLRNLHELGHPELHGHPAVRDALEGDARSLEQYLERLLGAVQSGDAFGGNVFQKRGSDLDGEARLVFEGGKRGVERPGGDLKT